ncbi:hypothetical protein NGA_0447800 [Nannochloropsis gaditana CCMP526]|uniref:uncharacterized protein n=1 Tax=Nannochloropsis gaditana (strain CCMP526) TaxID=1093141 RepID=UPI00029F6DD2|nr:hypothetical protein NGA_0447800 [Nannochloropsis gaditana CCMP526]EKU22930.1 hypothetical protein NGA_0447800 [Nannochloropsis gaditana CCMP526]|eukprot:XP_005853428.1 hypothetical protein NGA_0447800 [Nannochloropsis gaditana CCMP526]
MDGEFDEEEGSDREQDSFTYDVVAARSLRKGEEATCDYFLAEWEGEKVGNCPQPCLCSAGEGVCGGLRMGFKHLPFSEQILRLHAVADHVFEAFEEEKSSYLCVLDARDGLPPGICLSFKREEEEEEEKGKEEEEEKKRKGGKKKLPKETLYVKGAQGPRIIATRAFSAGETLYRASSSFFSFPPPRISPPFLPSSSPPSAVFDPRQPSSLAAVEPQIAPRRSTSPSPHSHPPPPALLLVLDDCTIPLSPYELYSTSTPAPPSFPPSLVASLGEERSRREVYGWDCLMRHHCRPSTLWIWETGDGGQGEGEGGREGKGGSKSGSGQVLHDNATRCLRLEHRTGRGRRGKIHSGVNIRRGYRVVATKEIGAGEELTVDYQDSPAAGWEPHRATILLQGPWAFAVNALGVLDRERLFIVEKQAVDGRKSDCRRYQ